jgi:hypothetical protein
VPRAIHTLVAEAEREFGALGAARLAEAVRNKARRMRILRECPTPGALAQRLVPTTIQTPMLDRVDEAIVAADAGEQRRWIINTPPQEGKSTRICRDAALWLLLRNPDRRIVIASYQQNLAEVSTLAVRRLIETYGSRPGDPEENNLLGLSIERTPAAAGNWRIAGRNGGMIAVGIGSGTTGRPGDVIVVDDPLADAEAADSPVQRRKVIDWWTSVIQTRLVAASIVIVVQTRWNEEDLSGWLKANDGTGSGTDAARYAVLTVPAQAEAGDQLGRAPGEWLTSARERSVTEWEETRREVIKGGARWWFALYQQRPAPPSGDTFHLEWFDRDRVWERPPGPPPVVVIDPADNTGSGDEAGILVASTDVNSHIYLGPDYSGHYTVGRWVRVALLAVARHKAGSLVYEQSLSGLARDVAFGWAQLHKQARILRRLNATDVVDPDIVDAGVAELCTPEDSEQTRGQYRAELLEVWPLVDAILDYPVTGPSIRRIIPKGTKAWRAQAASPRYEHRGVSHVGDLSVLEHQMVTWMPGQKSPDRMDTAVHAVLLLSGASVAVLAVPDRGQELPTRSTRLAASRGGALPRSTLTRR